jgi:predicted RNA-binding Zn ribbon-like protein
MSGPATRELELLRAFVNTTTADHQTDVVSTPERLRAWLVERSLLPPSAIVTPAEHREAMDFREALRALAAANGPGELDPSTAATLDRLGGRVALSVRVAPDGELSLVAGGEGVSRALGQLFSVMYQAVVDGSFERLKSCANDTCGWLFYDRSRNRSGKWCEMQTCGNMINARAYRRRQRADSQPTESPPGRDGASA